MSRVNPAQDHHISEMQLLLKFRDGGPGFTVGFHEERRASLLAERGMLSFVSAVYKSKVNRLGVDVVQYRNRYSVTDAGKDALHDYQKRGSRA